jgi:nucleotide-binding universal stress UspA family protein
MNFKNILVAVDFSCHSEAALKLAIGLVESTDGELHLVHVFPESMVLAPPYGPALPMDFGMKVERAAVEHFQKWTDEFCPAGLAVTTNVRRGNPSKRIVETADELDVDLIVMGTRGTTGLERLLAGSVAARTIRTARCPVLTTQAET